MLGLKAQIIGKCVTITHYVRTRSNCDCHNEKTNPVVAESKAHHFLDLYSESIDNGL